MGVCVGVQRWRAAAAWRCDGTPLRAFNMYMLTALHVSAPPPPLPLSSCRSHLLQLQPTAPSIHKLHNAHPHPHAHHLLSAFHPPLPLPLQLEAQSTSTSATELCRALCAIVQLGGKPTHLLANSLVIKTQQQLLSAPPPAAAAGGHEGGTPSSPDVLIAGVPAADFAAALWACAAAGAAAGGAKPGLKLPPNWTAAAVKQLSAEAEAVQLPPAALYHTLFAAAAWGVTPPPRPLLLALQGVRGEEAEDISALLLRDYERGGSSAVLNQVSAYLAQQQQQQQHDDDMASTNGSVAPAAPGAAAAAGIRGDKGAEASAFASAAAQLLVKWVAHQHTTAAAARAQGTSQLDQQQLLQGLQERVQELQRAVQQQQQQNGGSSSAPAASVAALGDVAHLLDPLPWCRLIKGIAYLQQQQQQQQQGQGQGQEQWAVSDVEGLQDVVRSAAAAVQATPQEAATSAAAAEWPTLLAALVQLQLPINQDWLSAVMAALDAAAAAVGGAGRGHVRKGYNWFRDAVPADVLAYLQALAELHHQQQQSVSLVQCSALCNSLAVKLKQQQLQLQEQQQALLLVLLAQTCGTAAEAAANSSTGSISTAVRQQLLQLKQQLQAVFAAGLPRILAWVGSSSGGVLPLSPDLTTELINVIAYLGCSLEDLGISSSSSSSDSGSSGSKAAGKQKGAGVVTPAAAAAADDVGGEAAAAPSQSQLGCLALLGVAFEAVAAAGTAAAAVADDGSAQADLLSALWLLHALPESAVPDSLQQQAFAVTTTHLSQQEAHLSPGDAARFFVHTAKLALATDPSLQQHDVFPDASLGGIFAQLLQDAEADWGHETVTTSELVQLPKLAMKLGFEVPEPELYTAAVYARLQQLAAGPTGEVLAVSRRGCGPVELLAAVCWLVMETRPGTPGDTTLDGLHALVNADSSSSTDGDSDSSSSSTAAGETPAEAEAAAAAASSKFREMFTATSTAIRPHLASLSGPQLVELAHAFVMGGMVQEEAWGQVWDRLAKPQELAGLNPGQQLALLCVISRLHTLAKMEGQEGLGEEIVGKMLKVGGVRDASRVCVWREVNRGVGAGG